MNEWQGEREDGGRSPVSDEGDAGAQSLRVRQARLLSLPAPRAGTAQVLPPHPLVEQQGLRLVNALQLRPLAQPAQARLELELCRACLMCLPLLDSALKLVNVEPANGRWGRRFVQMACLNGTLWVLVVLLKNLTAAFSILGHTLGPMRSACCCKQSFP